MSTSGRPTYSVTCQVCGKMFETGICDPSVKCPHCRKPPLGIMPEWLWKEQRLHDLLLCATRNWPEGEGGVCCKDRPLAVWLDEVRRLLNELLLPEALRRELLPSEGATDAD